MKHLHILASVALVLVSTASTAQVVKGNEAVEALPGGGKRVQTAPLPTTGPVLKVKPCRADGNCNAGSWHMVETEQGLMECTEVFARPDTCRASSYGTTKLFRLWVVKSQGEWLQCQYPDLGSKCTKVFARPPANLAYPAVQ